MFENHTTKIPDWKHFQQNKRRQKLFYPHGEKNNHSISQTAILNLQKVISYFVREAEGCSKITIVTPEM